jgi:predicted DNA-binding transcriptional regulator AlpA
MPSSSEELEVTTMPTVQDPASQKVSGYNFVLLTPEETATCLKVSLSWLAKARMRGDGPAYIRVGRSIRYSEAALLQWMKSRQRLSTSEQ